MNLTKAPLRTLFLDAGGVLVNPNWDRVADAMNRHGVPITGDALRAAEPHAKKEMDVPSPIPVSDQKRGWVYFNLVLGQAGVQPADGVYKALDELRTYHRTENLWESSPADAKESLQRLRDTGLKLVVVSNANGTVKHLFGRLGLAPYFDLILDSQEEGIEKPDPRFFRIAMDKSGADPRLDTARRRPVPRGCRRRTQRVAPRHSVRCGGSISRRRLPTRRFADRTGEHSSLAVPMQHEPSRNTPTK